MLCIAVTIGAGWLILRPSSTRALPPLPLQPLPFIGNLHQLRGNNGVKESLAWHQRCGPLLTLKPGRRTVILIGDRDIANALLSKRGRIYSSRPHLTMALDVMSKGDHTVFLPYGPKWKAHSRLHVAFIGHRVVKHYRRIQELESLKMLQELLAGVDAVEAFPRFQTSLINTLAFGAPVTTMRSTQMREVQELSKAFIDASATGSWWVDSFPALRCLPSWLAPWKRFGEQIHAKFVRITGTSIAAARNTQSWNWVKYTDRLKGIGPITDHELCFVFGSLYQAGVDIVTLYLQSFLVAWITHPGPVLIAQRELDRVVGPARLPSFSDVAKLTYCEAFVKEVLRWRPLASWAMPHCLTEEDTFMGYRFPKGTMFIANQYAMDMDRETWEDPECFRPERWLNHPSRNPASFGFGRRMCPGSHLVMESLSIIIPRMLWALTMKGHARGERGEEVDSNLCNFRQEGPVLIPPSFEPEIWIRDEHRQRVLDLTMEATEKDVDVLLRRIGKEFNP
ncbi:cytochrome P450 [Aspergillus homomorphus CBS 101889]|uniref:Cytochrome P450 n=1 Tax=Aspergillus homomorphus (strain CBS 101889) TaxID=1450537 RepID=A0A395I970_ASPHC|nr:cytochrome P450 [Aspergillus homomorphus CBS 101889]RAL14684.1 cytochrome P450 [Aspergillus homomorphus CBS 101889]